MPSDTRKYRKEVRKGGIERGDGKEGIESRKGSISLLSNNICSLYSKTLRTYRSPIGLQGISK